MSIDPRDAPRPLPDRPNLRHLKDQAKDLLKAGAAASLTDAQFRIARRYGFASWPKLKAHVDALEEVGQLKLAIDSNDLPRVQALMTRNPALHRAPLGYGKDGPLTWVAECRVPWEPPSETRLAMAAWMITHGSDVNQGGGGPLGRAALNADRIPMMALLVAHGADVNAVWRGSFPIIFSPCESLDPEVLRWLLAHGADPDPRLERRAAMGEGSPGTALDYAIGTYARSQARLAGCIDALLDAGGTTRYGAPGVLDLLRGRLDALAAAIDADASLVHRRYPELDGCGMSGGRRLAVQDGTLLHVAAEFGAVDAAALLLDRGADVNAATPIDAAGIGGHTAIFHAVSQYHDFGLDVARLLIARGADLSRRVTLPGDYEQPDERVTGTALGYALRFGGPPDRPTVRLLREHGAPE